MALPRQLVAWSRLCSVCGSTSASPSTSSRVRPESIGLQLGGEGLHRPVVGARPVWRLAAALVLEPDHIEHLFGGKLEVGQPAMYVMRGLRRLPPAPRRRVRCEPDGFENPETEILDRPRATSSYIWSLVSGLWSLVSGLALRPDCACNAAASSGG